METLTPPPPRSPVTGTDGDGLHSPHASTDHNEDLVAGQDLSSLSQEHKPSSPMGRQVPVTRTVAIIKNHALQHRFDIEPRIQEASFEIVKERQMEFDTETEPDVLYDLFGEDTDSLAEGPVWVYVLERKRAVEVWNTLMGDRSPEIARVEAPNSLRALYGSSLQQNAVMGSPDTQTAEYQIAALFASSPPFRSVDLPAEADVGDRYGSIRSLSSAALESLRAERSDAGFTESSVTNGSTINGSNGGRPSFKARPVPATHAQPDIVPRMTRAAALRINGGPLDKSPNRARAPITKERLAETFANVPGHKRTSTIAVASTAPPVVAPRMTKAASLRIAKEAATNGRSAPSSPAIKKRAVTDGSTSTPRKSTTTFEGVPGHKRRETISVASVAPPTVTPRLNKSSALRAMQKEGVGSPPSSFRGSASPSISRTASTESRRQSLAPSALTPSRTPSRAPVTPSPARRASSALDVRNDSNSLTENGTPAGATRSPSVAGKPRPRPSSTMMAPSITPRTNKSAALRVAKKEAEAAAATAAAAKKSPRAVKPPPSSFKNSTVVT